MQSAFYGRAHHDPSPEEKSLIKVRFVNGDRVIENLVQLAQDLYLLAGEGYREPATLVPPLSEILSGKRRCPKQFYSPLLQIVERRALDRCPEDVARITELFRDRLANDTAKFTPIFQCERPDVMAFTRSTLSTRHFVAILPDSVFDVESGRTLLKVALQRIGILADRGSHTKPLRLSLWFRGRSEAIRSWLDIQEFVQSLEPTRSPSSIEETLIKACSDDALEVFAVPPIACATRVVVAEPEEKERASGFTLNMNERTGMPSLSQMHSGSTQVWLRDAYIPLSQSESGDVRRITALSVFGQ